MSNQFLKNTIPASGAGVGLGDAVQDLNLDGARRGAEGQRSRPLARCLAAPGDVLQVLGVGGAGADAGVGLPPDRVGGPALVHLGVHQATEQRGA